MGNPKHQHFIPRSYLKYFAERKEDQYWIDSLMRGEDEKIIQLTTTNVCVQKNLYTFPLNTPGDRFAIEKFYAIEVDAQYSAVYEMLTNANITVIGNEDKRKILNTILSLFFRTPRFLNYRNEKLDSALNRMASEILNPEQEITIGLRNGKQKIFKRKELELLRQELKVKNKENFLIDHFSNWQDFVNYKMQCGMEVITVDNEVPIVTSDNPVQIMDMNGQINLEDIFHHDNIIEIPINRNTYMIIFPNSVAENEQRRIIRSKRDKYFVAGINKTTEKYSDLRLIGYPGDLEIHFESQKVLGEWNTQNISAFHELIKKTNSTVDLMNVIKKNGTAICQDVANRVKEIRETGSMNDDEMFNKLILVLAQNGYLTV